MGSSTEDEPKIVSMFKGRIHGELTKQLHDFYAACMRGKSIVLRTPKGDICSPAYVEALIRSKENAARENQTFKVIQALVKAGSISDSAASHSLAIHTAALAQLNAQQKEKS